MGYRVVGGTRRGQSYEGSGDHLITNQERSQWDEQRKANKNRGDLMREGPQARAQRERAQSGQGRNFSGPMSGGGGSAPTPTAGNSTGENRFKGGGTPSGMALGQSMNYAGGPEGRQYAGGSPTFNEDTQREIGKPESPQPGSSAPNPGRSPVGKGNGEPVSDPNNFKPNQPIPGGQSPQDIEQGYAKGDYGLDEMRRRMEEYGQSQNGGPGGMPGAGGGPGSGFRGQPMPEMGRQGISPMPEMGRQGISPMPGSNTPPRKQRKERKGQDFMYNYMNRMFTN